MKIRNDFVTNSSSTQYVIINKSNEDKQFIDFILENKALILSLYKQYYMNSCDAEVEESQMEEIWNQLLNEASKYKIIFPAGSMDVYDFEDHNTIIESLLDYGLRSGGESKSFIWRFYRFNR